MFIIKYFILSLIILCFLLLELFPSCSAYLFDISIEGEKTAHLDTVLVPKGYSEIKPISPRMLQSIISKDNRKFKVLHIYTSWCTFGSAYIDSILTVDTSKFKLYLVSGDLNTQKQINLLRKYLYSKGFYDESYIIDFKTNIFDLKNQDNIQKFAKYFVPSYNVKDFPLTILFNENNELVGTLTGLSFSWDSLTAYCSRR